MSAASPPSFATSSPRGLSPLAISTMPILIVDDYGAMLGVLRRMLLQLGFQSIVEASNGQNALNATASGRIKLVICDLRMVGMDGLELLRALRGNPANERVPFIMVSGHADRANVRDAIDSGVTDFISKPFNVATLKAKLSKILGPI